MEKKKLENESYLTSDVVKDKAHCIHKQIFKSMLLVCCRYRLMLLKM